MRNPNLGWALSSAAGPISNLLIAAATLIVASLTWRRACRESRLRGRNSFLISVGLAVFNLVPLPPLDGFGFIFGLAPRPLKVVHAADLADRADHAAGVVVLAGVVPGFPNFLQRGLLTAERNLGGLLLGLTGAL